MPDIEKLKQEAESAVYLAANSLRGYVAHGYPEEESVIARIIDATAKQIALQAAEKEAEQENDEPSFECNRSHPHENMSYGCLRKTVEARLTANPAPIADDGWIKWEGGECPVTPETHVCIRWHDGDESVISRQAQFYSWTRNGSDIDIIAYRIIQPAADRVEES